VIEACLNDEEERMNREMKTFHPVYNNMAFPDPLNRTARTVTATCTRVSRESIVIASPEHRGKFRRLTVRERACLQSFPITYQFFGNSHSQKLKMVGNAVPPLFTFYLAQAILNTPAEKIVLPAKGIQRFRPTVTAPTKTKPDLPGGSYALTRRFRAAIPNLRFKSGVRFELSNGFSADIVTWQVNFFFGNSKNIVSIDLDARLLTALKRTKALKEVAEVAWSLLQEFDSKVVTTTAANMQAKWAHKDVSSIHPYELVDAIGRAVAQLQYKLERELPGIASKTLLHLLEGRGQDHGLTKVLKHAEPILAGLIVSSLANSVLRSKTFNETRK
jgi:DNA (cytosine-5)-methyltransferase 1